MRIFVKSLQYRLSLVTYLLSQVTTIVEMATSMESSFDVWLTQKLKSVSPDIDTDVFVSYIIGILDTEDDNEEKLEGVTGFLEGVMEPSTASDVGQAILDEWTEFSKRNQETTTDNDDIIGEKLSEMMEKHSTVTVKEKQLTAEEKSRKAAILKQYAEVSESDSDDDEFGEEISEKQESSSDGLMAKNVNKEMVDKSIREARVKSKEETEKKKDKDKQDRLAQKQKVEDRKNTEKKRTQKGERRR